MATQSSMDLVEFGGMGTEAPMVRLCNFTTGKSDLTAAHRAWITQQLMPLIRNPGGTLYIRLWGYASKLGPSEVNKRLSLSRASAVQKFIDEQAGQSLANIETGGYGETRSAGTQNDNSPVYRAVDVWVSRGTMPPPKPTTPPDVSDLGTKMYFGVGVKFGGIAIGGTQTIEGYVFSVDSYQDQAYMEARVYTAGLGLGGGANAVLIIAYGAKKKTEFAGLKFDGWDFAVSLGGRWGDALKAAKGMSTVARIGKALQQGNRAKGALRLITKLSPQEWEKVGELIKASRDALGADPNSKKPQLNVFDIPLVGMALEVSVYKWWGTVTNFH